MSCARVEQLEAKLAKVSLQVHDHTLDLAHLGTRISGLAHAHDATLVAVRASTEASQRLSQSWERMDGRLNELLTDYSRHKLDSEREKRTWPRLALWIWGASLTAGISLGVIVLQNWRAFVQFLHDRTN